MDIEDVFSTVDIAPDGSEVRFECLEDESGDVFWCFGHPPPEKLIGEVNAWLKHLGVRSDNAFPITHPVEHLWAKVTDDEHFQICTAKELKVGETMFTVSRLVA